MTATISTKKMPSNTRTIDMASYKPLPRRGLRATGIWSFLVAVICVVSLAETRHVSAQARPTEAQILELLKKKNLMRCPTNGSETGCGGTSTAPLETGAFDVFFDSGSVVLDRRARTILVALAARLSRPENAGRAFLIGGHTDATGSEAYNQRLSARRAEAVRRFLVACCGVDRTKLATAGFGKQLPKKMADPYADENRRVNINALSAIHNRESER